MARRFAVRATRTTPEGEWSFEGLPCGACPLRILADAEGVEYVYTSPDPFEYCGSQSGFTVWVQVTLRGEDTAEVLFLP